jgi:glycosyltransferase involved in cell wall biosynthesis
VRDRSITLLNNQGLDQHGGGVRILERLATWFARENDVHIVAETAARDGPFVQHTIPPLPSPRGPAWRWQPLRRVRHLARVVPPLLERADVVICLDPHFVQAIANVRPRLCAYVSLSAVPRQEWWAERGATALLRAIQYAWIERRMLRRAHVCVVASRFHAAEIRRFELVPGFSPLVLPPVFAVPGAAPTRAASPPIVLVVARLVRSKNVEAAIDLAERTRDLDCRFVIVGDGDQREALERRARPLGQRVHFAGSVEAAPFYRDATALFHASRYESFGIVLVEAMQHGVVPLCGAPGPRCRTATAEIVTDGVSGLWFDLDDAASGERALRSLLGEPTRRVVLAAGARARANELLARDYGADLERALDDAGDAGAG